MKKILLFLSFLLMSIGIFGTDTQLYFEGWESHHRTSGSNDYTSSPKTYGDFTFVYADAVSTGNPLTGSYHAILRHGKKCGQRTCSLTSGALLDESYEIHTIKWNCKRGVSGQTLKVSYSTDGTTWIEGYSAALPSSKTERTIVSLSIIGPIYLKFEVSYNNNGNSNYDANIDDISIWGEEVSSSPKYAVTYNPNGGTGTMTDDNEYSSGEIVTILSNTFTRDGYTFDHWNTKADDSGIDYIAGNTFTISGNITLYAQWTKNIVPPTPEPTSGLRFSLVTDIEDLVDGDSIVIINGDSIAMSTTQNSNNRGTTKDIYYNNYKKIITLTSEDVQIIEVKKVGDNWALNVGTGYLYADGANSNNYLKTRTTNTDDNKGYWDIAIDEDNEASIVAQCSCTRNILQFNRNGNNPIFSCYNGSQEAIKIFKKINSEYTVIFKNNGINCDTIYTTKRLVELPIPPMNTLFCKSTSVFVGWSSHDISTTNEKPDDLFQTIKHAPIIESDKTFYAVFADEESLTQLSKNFTLTIDKSDFIGGGYDACNGRKTSIAKSTDGQDTIHVEWTSDKIYKNASAMQWQATNGTIYNNTSLGTITSFTLIEKEDNTGVYTIYFGSSEQPTSNTTVGNSYFKTVIGNKYGRTNSITITFTKDITPKRYSNYTTYCIDTLQIEGNWNVAINWKHDRIPQFNEAAVLLKPTTIDIPHATAKYVILDKSSSNTGKLTINANKGLEVQDTISVYNGTSYQATTTYDLILESSDAGNASLIFNNNNNSQATVCLYSKAKIENETWNWQYMGTAMTELNALYNYYGSWIYRWDKDAGWEVVPNGGTMNAWTGYCITQENPEWYATTGTLIPTDTKDTTLSIKPNGYMVFANSWTAPIHIDKFNTETNFKLDTANVYLFNTGSAPNGSVAGTEAGTHIVIPINSAPYTGDSLIAPQQGFFVTTGEYAGEITMNYKTLVRTNGNAGIVAGPMKSPKRAMSLDKPNVLKIFANGSIYKDKLVILEREDFSEDYDNGWDGRKSNFGTLSPSIYVVNNNGTYDAVSAIPDYEGTVLGFKPGTDIAYSLTFEYNGDETLYLNDIVTLESTLIDNDSRYVFTSNGNEEIRFIISSTPYSGVTTKLDNVETSSIKKFIINNNIYIIHNGQMFNVLGQSIK